MGMGRRRFIQIGAAGAAGVLLGGNVLAACGDDDDSAADTTTGATTPGTTAAGTSPATTPAPSGGAALDHLRLGFAYIGPINDNGWTQEHHRGRQLVFDTLGDKVSGTYVENVLFDPAVTTPIFEDLASNHDFVIANTEYSTLLSDVSDKHPDVHFLECDGHKYTSNLYSYYVKHTQPTYALGVAAALLVGLGVWLATRPSPVAPPSELPVGAILPLGYGLFKVANGVRPPSVEVTIGVVDE
jgi:basic membrane lipoprotein Med (substrate-binding protein (PBP1-ABC) superfamily)